MSSQNQTTTTSILIFGGTGVIGRFITDSILTALSGAPWRRVALFTSEKTKEEKVDLLAGWQKKGLELIVGDVTNEEEIKKAYKGKQ
jgi:FlaA1/EpsC-like NDP-sugar epimerase